MYTALTMPAPKQPQNPKKPKFPRRGPKLPGGDNGGGGWWTKILTAIFIFLVIASAYSLIVGVGEDREVIPISQLVTQIEEGQVTELVVEGNTIVASYEDMPETEIRKETESSLTETLANYGISQETLRDVDIKIQDQSGLGYWLANLAPFILPLLFIIFFIWLLTRQVKGAGMQALNFGQSRARFIDPENKSKKVTFDDVAGAREAKEELKEIVDFLKHPKKFIKIGAEIPKGVILMGAPGTGKTLLARAVAGEAKVPFYSISGSEFVEMFVGVGASRVRDLFKVAKKSAPAIIFVDEIDAVGRSRGVGVGGGNDEREQTLNQILVELDGFEPNEQVIVMAATNRPDVLDPALLRPGRFDRRVTVDLPDLDDREKILEVHVRKKPLEDGVDLRVVAERTPGFSGADLASLVNEAAIVAARDDRKTVAQDDFLQAIEKVMLGPERLSHLLSEDEKKITAHHEAGHALVASVLEHTDPVHKVTIISRGKAAGYVLNLPTEEKKLKTKKQFLDELAMSLGGYAAEQIVFGDLTTGPSNDLEKVTKRARDMVTRFGMSEELGPVALETESGRVLYGRGTNEYDYSDAVAAKIDREVSRLVNEALERAKSAIKEHKELFEAIALKLLDKETLERKEFEALLEEYGIEPKRAKDTENQDKTVEDQAQEI